MPNTRWLIINADDLGYDPAVSRGILEGMRSGIVSSATLMVNGPTSREAAERAKGLSIGLHFNLARWAPLSRAFPAEHLTDGALDERHASALPGDVVAAECQAQILQLEAWMGAPPTHIDVHRHLHRNPGVLEGVITTARAWNLPVRSIDSGMRTRLQKEGIRTNPSFIGDAGAEAYWTLERFKMEMDALPEGLTELMCHPGYAPETLKSGYSHQRETELKTFLSPEARAYLAKKNIQLTDFRTLR